jgi:hypothetical protein
LRTARPIFYGGRMSLKAITDFSSYVAVGIFNGGKAYFSNIVPGTLIWVRIRTYGLKNVTGDWSDPAKIMVV